ncbi:hypothetical protein Tco_0681349 [Tanacetum coccineum]|uniref:Uncharacterized protein n=1 Tax=Tanacetum coccineum TaxID=301880 RepID=A0ABQ4XP97_9ASTR
MAGSQDDIPPPPPLPSQTPTQQTPHTVSTLKHPILKKGEYDIWAMKMEHYLAHTDYPIWEVIQNGNGPVSITTDTQGQIKVLPPRTAVEILARERERKARTTLLMALLHKITCKFPKNELKIKRCGKPSNLDLGEMMNQRRCRRSNQKYLRSLPSAWFLSFHNHENKARMDSLNFDDLYNNLRVFENDVKGSTASSSNTQNVAFVSENTSSTNDVSTAYGVSNPSDLEQLDEFDLEEMDLKCQVAMISMRMKKFYKKTECRSKRNQDGRRRDTWNSGNKDGRRSGKQEDSKALVTIDGEGVDWTSNSEEEEDYALMACNRSGSDTKRIKADRLLALRLQEEEREKFTMEKRAKFFHDTIAAQRRFLAEQRVPAIRNRPPTRTQLRSQMITYLKHVGNKKHSDLKNKTFEEIQALYEKVKRASNPDKKKKFVKEDVLTKVLAEPDVAEHGTKKRKGGHMKMIARKRKRPQPDVDSDDEHRKCLKIVTFEGTIDSEIVERNSAIARLNKVSSPDGDYLVIYRANGNFRAFNYLLEGDLKIMMESSTGENDQSDFWNNQQNWEIVRWRLYEACGVYILELEDGTVIHMLVERRYPLSKDLLQRMLDFRLEVEVESTAALDLIRFIKQQLNEEVFNSPCFMVKSWLVQDQTVLGKDYSNLLIADSLLKTIWFINAPCYGNEALASPKANVDYPRANATVNEKSNPLCDSFAKNYKANLVGLLLKRCCCVAEKMLLLKTCCRRIAKDVKDY